METKELIALLSPIPLPVQVDLIFQDLRGELRGLSEGTVFLHIRNEHVATYGVRHRLENRIEPGSDGKLSKMAVSEEHIQLFREMAADLVSRRTDWKRGTVSYKFSVRKSALHIIANFAEKDDCIVD